MGGRFSLTLALSQREWGSEAESSPLLKGERRRKASLSFWERGPEAESSPLLLGEGLGVRVERSRTGARASYPLPPSAVGDPGGLTGHDQ